MGVIYFSIIPTFEPSRYCKCWIVCFYYRYDSRNDHGHAYELAVDKLDSAAGELKDYFLDCR